MPDPARSDSRKLLALDGGGIRGLITIEALGAIERTLQHELGRDDSFVLADYFEYIAGTSTGAIIATCLALGLRVDRIRSFYLDSGEAMFDKASWLQRANKKYEHERLAQRIRDEIGEATTLGSPELRTLLLIVMRNSTTDSPWPLSNNPAAMYNDRRRESCNLDLPLWRLVRASTAAPTFFAPEVIDVGAEKPFVFVDGGVTVYNNPAFLLFLMATVKPYNLNWPAGRENVLLVSVGTGTAPKADAHLDPRDMNLIYNAKSVPAALMFAALNEQDMLCRVFGDCRHGDQLDREIGALHGATGPTDPKLFTYVRYNAELSWNWLIDHGLAKVNPRHVQKMDSTSHMAKLQAVGRAVGEEVDRDHFKGFL